jgi:hypothetical protein
MVGHDCWIRRRRGVLGALALVLGVLWWWAVLRVVLVPEGAGVVEGAVVAGGWGLSLLPVHVAARGPVARRGAGRGSGGASVGRGVEGAPVRASWRGLFTLFTKASIRRRSGGGSGPS